MGVSAVGAVTLDMGVSIILSFREGGQIQSFFRQVTTGFARLEPWK